MFFRGFVGRYTFKGNYHVSEGCLSSLDIMCSILFQRSNGWRIICERVAFQHLQVESKCNMQSLILTFCGKLPQVSGDQQTFIVLLHIPSGERHAHISSVSTAQHWSVIPRFHGSMKRMYLTQPGKTQGVARG